MVHGCLCSHNTSTLAAPAVHNALVEVKARITEMLGDVFARLQCEKNKELISRNKKAIVDLCPSESPTPEHETNPQTRQMLVTIVRCGLTGLFTDITVPSHILALHDERRRSGSVEGNIKV